MFLETFTWPNMYENFTYTLLLFTFFHMEPNQVHKKTSKMREKYSFNKYVLLEISDIISVCFLSPSWAEHWLIMVACCMKKFDSFAFLEFSIDSDPL